MAQEFLIALGSNLGSAVGDNAATLAAALRGLTVRGLRLRRVSRFFSTPCFPPGAGPDYVNACAAVTAELAPAEVLDRLHAVEADFGRERTQRWASRTLDLDMLAAGDRVLPDAETQERWRTLPADELKRRAPEGLVLPHPRMQERGFVLVPLADIAPGWRHPLLAVTVSEMLAALPDADRAGIVPLG